MRDPVDNRVRGGGIVDHDFTGLKPRGVKQSMIRIEGAPGGEVPSVPRTQKVFGSRSIVENLVLARSDAGENIPDVPGYQRLNVGPGGKRKGGAEGSWIA